MSQITTNNNTKEDIQFINNDNGGGSDTELTFKIGGYEITIIRSGESVEVIIDEQTKEKE